MACRTPPPGRRSRRWPTSRPPTAPRGFHEQRTRDSQRLQPAPDLLGRHLDRHRAAGAVRAPHAPGEQLPRAHAPEIQVQAVYPGATAEDVASAVAAPIEQQLSGLDGLLYFKSSNASDGTMNLQVYFDLSRDLDLAAVDVQNQVSLAQPQLPQEVVRQGITIT